MQFAGHHLVFRERGSKHNLRPVRFVPGLTTHDDLSSSVPVYIGRAGQRVKLSVYSNVEENDSSDEKQSTESQGGRSDQTFVIYQAQPFEFDVDFEEESLIDFETFLRAILSGKGGFEDLDAIFAGAVPPPCGKLIKPGYLMIDLLVDVIDNYLFQAPVNPTPPPRPHQLRHRAKRSSRTACSLRSTTSFCSNNEGDQAAKPGAYTVKYRQEYNKRVDDWSKRLGKFVEDHHDDNEVPEELQYLYDIGNTGITAAYRHLAQEKGKDKKHKKDKDKEKKRKKDQQHTTEQEGEEDDEQLAQVKNLQAEMAAAVPEADKQKKRRRQSTRKGGKSSGSK